MSEAKVRSEDIELVFQRLRALPGNKVNIFSQNYIFNVCIIAIDFSYLLNLRN